MRKHMQLILTAVCFAFFAGRVRAEEDQQRAAGQAVWEAAEKGDLQKVKEVLDREPSIVDVRRGLNGTPLMNACRMGHKDIVVYLLSRGADPNAYNTLGLTPLHFASNGKIADILLTKGARPDGVKTDWREVLSDGVTPLHRAAGFLQDDIVKVLIQYKADVNAQNVPCESQH